MLKNTIKIELITSKRSGILPILMKKLGSLGLLYRRCNVKEFNAGFKLTITCEGEMSCEPSCVIESIREIPNIESVLHVSQSQSSVTDTFEQFQGGISNITELHPLRVNDSITQDVLHIVENRLSEIFGPTANLLLKSAAKKSSCVGDLFILLAEDLTGDQKVAFFKHVEGLDSILVG